MLDVVWLIPALPLAGFLCILLFGRRLGDPDKLKREHSFDLVPHEKHPAGSDGDGRPHAPYYHP